MKYIKKYWVFILALGCLFVGFLPVIINNKSVLIFNGDSYHQIYQFYLGANEKLKNNNLSFYDFSIGFGANSFAMLYYLFSPFYLPIMFLSRSMIQYSFLYMTILKLFFLFAFTYIWLKKVFKYESSHIIGSFIITFSGWIFSYLHLSTFLDAFIFYPLALYFIEVYKERKKYFLLCLVLAIIGIINYYFLYMFIPFVILYYFFRIREEGNSIKTLFIESGKFFLLIILSIGLAAFILLPCAYMLKSNPRFEYSNTSLFSHLSLNELYKVLSGLFLPPIDHESTSVFIDISKYNFIGWGGGASLYMFVIAGVLYPGVFYLDKARKSTILWSSFLLAIAVFFKKIWFILQLNIETRWFYVVLFLGVYGILSVNDAIEDKKINKKFILYSCLGFNVLLWSFYLISKIKNYSSFAYLIYMVGFSSFLSILVYVYYFKKIKYILYILLCLEATYTPLVLLNVDKPVSYKITDMVARNNRALEYIRKDRGFYRVLYNDEYYDDSKSYFRYTTSNIPYSYDFMGASFYSTIYNSEMEDFLSRLKNRWQMDQRSSSWDMYNLLSTKYIYGLSNLKQVPFGYEETYKDDFIVYKNKYFVELGFAYDKTISKKTFDSLSYLNQDLIMADYLVIDSKEEDVLDLVSLKDYGSIGKEDIRYYKLDQPVSNVNIYLENGNIENIQVDLLYEDKLVYSGYFWQYNYLDFYVDEDTKVDMIIVYGNNENQNQDINLSIRDMSSYDEYFKNRFKEKFYDVSLKKDYIDAKIDLEADKYVFTSIGYDKGWQVYVDNKKVATEKVQLGFLGFKVPKGRHRVEFKYKTPYLKDGLIISLVSLSILILVTLKKKGQVK